MASHFLLITEICPEFAKYTEKAMCALYAIHAPVAGTKRC